MKFMIGVLALAAVCRAVPEADPQLLLGPSPLTTPYASPFPYAFGNNVYNPYTFGNNFYNPYFNTLPVASPVVASKVITPIVATPNVAGVIPPVRPYTPYDCVTPEGCAVRTLKEHGLAKREATAEAEAEASADPEAFYGSYYNPYYGFNGLNNGYYPYSYGAYPYGVNSLWNYAAAGRGYATGFEQFEGYPAATAPLPAFPASVAAPLAARLAVAPAPVAAPLAASIAPAPLAARFAAVPAPVAAPLAAPIAPAPFTSHFAAPLLAAPAPIVKTVEVPAPVVKAVPATPLPIFRAAPFVHAPVPVVRQPVVTPIVKKVSKPVTYTHLGAHPIQPTTVFEETQEVVGHNFF